ncbi:MAG: ornithine carbamoyltransferase [Dehalococcoidia bacterium]
MLGRDFVSIADFSPDEIRLLLDAAIKLKARGRPELLTGRTLAMIFEKPSLRTRVSFQVAMTDLGGHAIYLSQEEVGLGVREPVKDIARVLSRYVDVIAARTYLHSTVAELADYADVPVINALSDEEHPCQALADLLTIHEKFGGVEGVRIAYIGDGNNVLRSLLLSAAMLGARVTMATPPGYEPPGTVLEAAAVAAHQSGGEVRLVREPEEAAAGADVIYTDVWTSMGQDAERGRRERDFVGYQVDLRLVAEASPRAAIMHDLPAHRGEEILDEAIESPQSVIFDQAENRLHAQRGLLAMLLAQPDL